MALPQLSRLDIYQALHDYEVNRSEGSVQLFPSQEYKALRPAAVILPMLKHNGQWHILLTLRSERLVEHRGQVAFPGGLKEPQDKDLKTTALREMQEEIGVVPDAVSVFGHLGDLNVITGYKVRIFVGEIPWPYPLTISGEEVQSAFIIPLMWLSDPENREIRLRIVAGKEFPVTFFKPFDGHELWGASAEMTLMLLSALGLV